MRCGDRRGPHRRRSGRLGHRRIVRLVGVGHGRRLGAAADLHGVGAIILFGKVDQLAVVRLAQELLNLGGLHRLLVALDLGHGLTQFLRAHRAGLSAQPADRLLDQAERAVEREPTTGGRCSGRLLRLAFLSAASATPSPTAALALLAWPNGHFVARGLGRGAGNARSEGNLVLPVVELGEVNETLVRHLHHELREAREPDVLLVERGIDLLHHLLEPV